MPARVGKAPWYKPVTTKKGNNYYAADGSQFSGDLSGWHAPRKRGWKNKASETDKDAPITRMKMTNPVTGKLMTVYRTTGYDDFLHFHNMDNDEDALNFAAKAFSSNNPASKIVESDGAGHIRHLAYAVQEQILKVDFAKGAECYFFRVPPAVAGYLIAIARHGPDLMMKGQDGPRHVLGIKFWDFVRVRGTVASTRYPFTYSKGNISSLTNSNKRYVVRLTPDNIKVILGAKYKGPLREGDLITTVLSEEEYKQYLLQAKSQHEMPGATTLDDFIVSRNAKSYDDDTGEITTDVNNIGVSDQLIRQLEDGNTGGEVTGEHYSVLSKEDLERYKDLSAKLQGSKNLDAYNIESDLQVQLQQSIKDKDLLSKLNDTTPLGQAKELRNLAKLDKYFDQRRLEDKVRTRYKYKDRKRALPSDFANDAEYLEYKALDKQYNLPVYAKRSLSKYWTTNDLKAMADPKNPMGVSADHIAEYSKLLQDGDYRGALTFLKTHSTDTYINGKATNKQHRYAAQMDRLARQEINDDN